jgi:hypothetical protein
MTPEEVWKLAPDWVTFIAQDPDGAWVGFELRPKVLANRWTVRRISKRVRLTDPVVKDWLRSLQERPR